MKYVAVLFLALAGCATASTTSFTDPAYRSSRYSAIIIAAPSLPLADRLKAEHAAVAELQKIGVQGMPLVDLAPPTRRLTPDEMQTSLNRSGAQAVLLLVIAGLWTDTTVIPGSTTPATAYTSGMIVGNTWNSTTTIEPGTTTPDTVIEKPRGAYRLVLFDAKTGAEIWKADSDARGSVFDDYQDLARAALSSGINQLRRDGLI